MSELSKALGNAGPKHTVKLGEKEFKFSLVDQSVKVEWEKRRYAMAREAVYVDRDHMDPEQYVKRLDAVRVAYEDGEYDFMGERSQKALKTASGAQMLLSILTGEPEMELLQLMSEKGPEVAALLKTILYESFPGMKKRLEKQSE